MTQQARSDSSIPIKSDPKRTTQEQILFLLKNAHGKLLSGQELADGAGISRTSVWKAVRSLQSAGLEIESVPRRGYRLLSLASAPNVATLRTLLPAEWTSAEIRMDDEVRSTNTELKMLLDAHGTDRAIVLAKTQTGGRGRYGRSFFSPEGGLYLSVGWRPKNGAVARLLTMAAALALQRSIAEELGAECSIRWINDLEWNHRKVAGILTEGVRNYESGTLDTVVLGVGLNLFPPKSGFPGTLEQTASTLFSAPCEIDMNRLIALFLQLLMQYCALPTADLLAAYRPLCSTLGHEITVSANGALISGKAVDIDARGALLLEDSAGALRHLCHGTLHPTKSKARQ